MKIIKKDLKRETKIKPENMDDLWMLGNIIAPGDVVGARTMRTIQNSDKGEKKPVFLKVKAENVELDEEGHRLKVHGKIIEGPDDVAFGYHSIFIEENEIFSLEKDWKSHEVLLLNDSVKYSGMKVLICVIDERRADFALATEVKVSFKASITSKSAGKQYGGESPDAFYNEVIDYLKENSEEADNIIIAGPGFTKDNLFSHLKDAKLKGKIALEVSSVTGNTGINEVIKRGGLERVMKSSRIGLETRKVEDFLAEIGRDTGLVTYGMAHVAQAVEEGACEEIIISDKMIKDEAVGKILAVQKQMGWSVTIINSTHEAGEKLLSMGGIAGFLRYKIQSFSS